MMRVGPVISRNTLTLFDLFAKPYETRRAQLLKDSWSEHKFKLRVLRVVARPYYPNEVKNEKHQLSPCFSSATEYPRTV